MNIHLTTLVVHVKRHERFETIVVFDDEEYKIPHTNVRLKRKLLKIPEGTRFEAPLEINIDKPIRD